MTDTAYLRARGFRRWYERELTRSHLHLVLLLLCAVALMAAMEAFSTHQGGQPLLMVASMLIAGVLGVWALRRYLFHLMRAELIAHQAVCPQCQAYGRWRVESHAEARASEGADAAASTEVRCSKCGHGWTIAW
jgi:ABC-type nickel/cobalt efflux system permease component RcnA